MKVTVIRSGELPDLTPAPAPPPLPASRAESAAERYHCLERQIAMLEGRIEDLELRLSVLDPGRDPY